jgi:putative spermidine/putrescine transport system substrate-binding protein
MSHPRPTGPWLAAGVLAAAALMLTACTSQSSTTAGQRVDSGDWDSVLAQADGQTVNWYMYGGDDTLNGFIAGYVADRLAELGVTLNQVRVTDTADAVNKVLGEKQAGRSSGGSVDAIWINGENFATGRPVVMRLGTRAAELPLRRLHPPRGQQRLRHTGEGL